MSKILKRKDIEKQLKEVIEKLNAINDIHQRIPLVHKWNLLQMTKKGYSLAVHVHEGETILFQHPTSE